MSDKTALVTGGTRGIGRAIAQALSKRGERVIVTGTRPDGQAPEGCQYEAIDFADSQATQKFADRIAAMGIDILINNAGINKIAPFAQIDPSDFAAIQAVNVTAPFLLSRAVLGHMKASGWGRIVNVSSIWGKISRAQRGAYSTSKFALDGMTAALAAEVAADGILVNCIAPGFIDTELTRRVLGADGLAKVVSEIPMGRLGKVEEIAAFAAWLGGPENTYISGQNIAIDGGFTRV
ncbi:Dehydrogenase with different specificities [Rhodospirillaceae bacterium LM-1]|nr:Dehydrogenase with different specificities [Rhodospirillaceae bacterium LM-1]